MSERAVTVQTGMVTPLGESLQAGTTLQNLDTVHAVWVSTNPGLTPGVGSRLGPLGSLSWTGGPCYAIVDTGVSAGVNLTVSDHAANPVNPVDTATAVAQQLNSKGVPNVLTGGVIYNGLLPGEYGTYASNAIYYDLPVDMSPYASVSIDLYLVTAATVRLQWIDTVTGIIFSGAPFLASGVPVNLMFSQTVKAPRLRLMITNLAFPTTSAPVLTMYGTNRILPEGLTYWDNSYTSTIASQAWAAGQQTSFTDLFKSKGGLATLRLSSSAATTVAKGFFGYRYYDDNTNQQNAFVLTTATAVAGPNTETETLGQAHLPPGSLQLFWQNSVTANTYDIKATITMGG